MRFNQNIKATGICGGLLLLVSADKEDAKAAVIEFNPEDDSTAKLSAFYDTVQKPISFNAFEPLATEAGQNYMLLLDQQLTEDEVKRINDKLAG